MRFQLGSHHVRIAAMPFLPRKSDCRIPHRSAANVAPIMFGLGQLVAMSGEVRGEAERPPNIVVILADDFGYECVGANGSQSYKTPVLDQLAATGMRFERCYSQPLCTPSRVQLLTGLYNKRNYLRFGILDPAATTFAQLFRDAGYATCVAGKWQLKGGFDGPKRFGFDDYLLWQLTDIRSRYPNPVLDRDGKVVEFRNGEYGPDLVSDHLCEFITRNKERPFLVFYPMILTHWPFEPTPDSPDWNPKAEGILKGHGNPKYFADMVTYMDKTVGKIIGRLEKEGLRENTLVIFTGDNGTAVGVTSKIGGRDFPGGKGQSKDAGMHVPLIVNWPGHIKSDQVNSDLIDFTDFFPTLLDIAGIERPKSLALDGQSFAPQLLGRPSKPREWIYSWYARNGGAEGVEFAADKQYKLYTDGRLFDIAADPLEEMSITDPAKLKSATATRAKLQRVLDQYKDVRSEAVSAQGGRAAGKAD
jgi:arylsulfatase A